MKSLLSFLLLVNLVLANEDIDLETDFLSSLDEVSEIATKTKLNIDDVPSFITILQSDKLQKIGIDTVFEALSQVPGVQTKREISGVPVVVFRGVSQKGEVKLMVDGVTINNSYRGSIYHYLEFPLELVERIEVIRGAGSVLYGSGAISGVINIITKSANRETQNEAFLSVGSYHNQKGGALVSGDISDFHIALDSYYQKNEKQVRDIDEHIKNYSVGLKISNEHFGFISRLTQTKAGNAYGVLGVPDTSLSKLSNLNRTIFSELSYVNSFSKHNSIKLLAGYTKYTQDVDTAHPALLSSLHANYSENSYYAQADFNSKSLENNDLLLGFKYEHAKTLKSNFSIGNPISDPNLQRDTISLYLNDQYAIASDIDISAGLRYDNYNDFGDSISPSLGIVYRATDIIRFKAQYSHAFRAPSWVELTSNNTLKAEKSDTLEFGMVFKENQDYKLKINTYISQIKDLITKDLINNKYIQNSKNKFYGIELETDYTPNNNIEINFLASYVNAKDADGKSLPDIANILASTALYYDIGNGFNIGSLIKYISSSKRAEGDLRSNFSSSVLYDQTISYVYKDFTLRLIVKDLFNRGTYYALPQHSTSNNFYAGGRNILLKANMEF